MRYFPFFFDMRNKSVLVVGGGLQASSKVRLIVKTEARITIVSPDINQDLQQFLAEGRIEWHERLCQQSDFTGCDIVYVATQSDAVNARLGAQARSAGALVAAVDQAEASDMITPALIDRDPVVIAIGTEGTSPVLARLIKARLAECLPGHLGRLACWAGSQRKRLETALKSSRERRLFWSRFFRFSSPFNPSLADDKVLSRRLDMILSADCESQGLATLIDASHPETDLLTLRARNKLYDADTLIYDKTISTAYLEYARREANLIPLSKSADTATLIQGELKRGHHVIYLVDGTSGDIITKSDRFRSLGVNIELLASVASPVAINKTNQKQEDFIPSRRTGS